MTSPEAPPPTGAGAEPRPAAVSILTTEHFTLQGARASTVSESTGRASMFIGAVSASLVALGLVASATRIGTAFFTFALVLLPTLSFVGLMTFERVLQSGIEDQGYARRIARLRAYYFDQAPELTPYLASVPPEQRLSVLGLSGGYWQGFRTVAGMVGVMTAVLVGSAAGVLAAVAADDSLVIGVVTGAAVAVVVLVALMRYQRAAWRRARTARLFVDFADVPS